MVVEGNLREIAGAEACGVEAFGPSPVVLGTVFGIKDRSGRQEHTLEFAQVLSEQAAEAGAHGLEEDEFLLLNDRDMLEVVQRAELLHIELSAVKTFFDILGIAVGIGEQLLELELTILPALGLVENLAAGINPLSAVFSGHMYTPVWIFCRIRQGAET